ncbi:hypothetical protein [Croceivirga radicis]|uniref:hypothetical protein n=1 Tax=Croceivirga radicis TaxID=1929488 RepID=UPI00178C4927|nr:hypothetical protein [Croceivirga radicis]
MTIMCYPQLAEAKHHSGNWLDDKGCLHVWSYDTAFFGLIKYNKTYEIFCGVTLE